MKLLIAFTLILMSTHAFADQYICRSVGTAALNKDRFFSYLDFKDHTEWIVDSEQGWRQIFPSYQFIGECELKTTKIGNIKLLECSSFLDKFVINLSGMTFAYTRIYEGNSVAFPVIDAAVGECEKNL